MMSDYIQVLAGASTTDRHELIEECIDYYGVVGVRELKEEQVRAFCRMKGLVE